MLFIIKRYIYIESILKDAHQCLVVETNGSVRDFGENLSPTEMILLIDLVKMLLRD